MKKELKNTLKSSLVVLVAILVVVGVSYASSSLSPSLNTVSPQGYTLSDIYNKLDTGASSVAHSVTTSASPAPTSYTLAEIWNKIPAALTLSPSSNAVPVGINRTATTLSSIDTDLVASNVRSGVTIFGVTGNYTGSGGSSVLTWTSTIPSLSIVNGVAVYQSGFGPQHGLCWSHGAFEIGIEGVGVSSGQCSTRQTLIPGQYSGGFYDGSVAQDGSLPLGATEYCDYLNSNGMTVATTPQHYWRLPTRTELYLKGSETALNGVYDPLTLSKGGFRNGNYFSNEHSDTNYYVSQTVGVHDSVNSVAFNMVNAGSYITAGSLLRTSQTHFRCVHD